MGVLSIIGLDDKSIADKASDYLLLALTPDEFMEESKMKEKVSILEAKNRIITQLARSKSKCKESQKKLDTGLEKITLFFEEMQIEIKEAEKLSRFNPKYYIESGIADGIQLSCKANATEKEKKEQKYQESIRDLILQKAKEKVEMYQGEMGSVLKARLQKLENLGNAPVATIGASKSAKI